MNRDIHDIYDVILKIIASTYQTEFLRYLGVENNMKKELKTEFTTISGNKIHLDFLCLLDNDTICHIEFQFPIAKPIDLKRFYNYNIIAEARHQMLTESYVVNFEKKHDQQKSIKIGESKSFHPKHFYLEDIDTSKLFRNINMKVKSNEKLTNSEEITLMLICLTPKCGNKAAALKQICELLKNEGLFDETKFEFIETVIKLEIENLLTDEEQKEVKKVIKMTPEVEKVVLKAINEVNLKVISEAKMEAWNEGMAEGKSEGRSEGLAEGRTKAMEEVARNLIGKIEIDEIAECTGLTIEEIEKLK